MATTPSGKAAESKAPTDTATQVNKAEQAAATKAVGSGLAEDHGVKEPDPPAQPSGRHESPASADEESDESEESGAGPAAEAGEAASHPPEGAETDTSGRTSGRGAGLHHR